jgi:hypothetical protein
LGGNVGQSEVVRGMVIGHDTLGSVKKVKDAKIAVFTESIKGPDTGTPVRRRLLPGVMLMGAVVAKQKPRARSRSPAPSS